MRERAPAAAIGVVFGVMLCWSGMTSPEVIRSALLFEQSYLFLFMFSAIATAVVGLRLDTRGWLLIGLVAGAVGFALVAGGPDFHGYGWLTATFHGNARWLIAPILAGAGVLIGFGSKLAGGCTSGNGLSGISALSPASVVATATFFATAIVVSFAIKALIA